MIKENKSPYRIYVQEGAILNKRHEEAYASKGIEISGSEKKRKGGGEEVEHARRWMCENFFDVRTFGAVMSTGINCGQVTGPVQFNFAKSVEPVTPLEMTITRMAVATEEESRKQEGEARTMGRKHIVPYGFYRAEGYISANFAKKTGFSNEDLEILWEALKNMFDHDHSAARGKMNARNLLVFKHSSAIGNAPAHKLFDLVRVIRKGGDKTPPRSYSDYAVSIEKESVPSGVEFMEML